MRVIREQEILLCDSDLAWSYELQQSMEEQGYCLKIAEEIEELWQQGTYCQGAVINIQEIDSMLFWGRPECDGLEKQRYQAIQGIRLIQPKIVVILPENDYELEYQCMAAGAVECIHKDQPMHLIQMRLGKEFYKVQELCRLHFGEVALDVQTQLLSCQEQLVLLTELECRVMEHLMQNGSGLTDKTELLLQLWQKAGSLQQNRMNSILRQLRQKIQNLPMRIVTCYGKGYYLQKRSFQR